MFADALSGQNVDISAGEEYAVSIAVETGIRDFAFSSDGSALAVVDHHGDILLWALCQDSDFADFYRTSRLKTKVTLSSPTLKYSLPTDLNPCSIQFLELGHDNNIASSTPLVLVGSSYNRRLHLINIGEGKLLQEIVLPSNAREKLPSQNLPLCYTKERQILTLGDTLSNSIYFFHLRSSPITTDVPTLQSDYIAHVAESEPQSLSNEFSGGVPPAFDYVTELPFFHQHLLQTLATTPSIDAYLDVFTAHNNGFTMLSPDQEDIIPANYLEAKRAPIRTIPNPRLTRVDIARESGPNTSTPKSLSRRSSVESLRSERATRPVLAKRGSNELHKRKGKTPVQENILEPTPQQEAIPNEEREKSPEIPVSPVAIVDKPKTPPPVIAEKTGQGIENGTLAKEIETILGHALDQQCTFSLISELMTDERLLTEQKRLMATGDDRHESILRVVSSTLTTNVGKLLEQTVRHSIEKSILPTVTTTIKKSVDQQLNKTLSAPLEKALMKEMRGAVIEGIQKALLDNNDGAKFSDVLSTALSSEIESSLQNILPSAISSSFDKSVLPLLSKMEERLQSSMEKSIQRIQKESLASQQDLAKKLDSLADSLSKLASQSQSTSLGGSGMAEGVEEPVSALDRQKKAITEQFKTGNFAAGIEMVRYRFYGLILVV